MREAKRLGIPTILLTNALDSRFSKEASVVIHVPRGEKGKIPLHGTVLLCGDDYFVRRLHRAAAHHQIHEAHQRVSSWVKAGEEERLKHAGRSRRSSVSMVLPVLQRRLANSLLKRADKPRHVGKSPGWQSRVRSPRCAAGARRPCAALAYSDSCGSSRLFPHGIFAIRSCGISPAFLPVHPKFLR